MGPRIRLSLNRLRFSSRFAIAIVAAVAIVRQPSVARPDTVTLRDGRQLDGTFTKLNTMQAGQGATPAPATKLIVMCDDGLRRYYFGERLIGAVVPAPPAGAQLEEINVPQRVARVGQRIGGIGAFINRTPLDPFGRQTIKMAGGPTGVLDVIVGITKITPVWCSFEGLQTANQSYVWEMRVATSSIPREALTAIIERLIDKKDADQRLKVVRLYLQQERYRDAEVELKKIIAEFPDRDNLKDVAKELKQLYAKQVLSEIETRSAAGQHQIANYMLDKFPSEGVLGQILQQVRTKVEEYAEQRQRGETIVNDLARFTLELQDEPLRKRIAPLVEEITEKMRLGTLDRMATYRRFADDPNSPPEQKLSLAISGWLLGANEATENIKVTLALAEIRDLIVEYMRAEDNVPKRNEILDKIKKMESASPKLIAALLSKMAPVLDLPAETQPGYYELSVPSVAGEADVTYYVQLPPEYDPHGSYPCVISLHGAGSTPEAQVEWWAGAVPKEGENRLRMGQASRHGYIVIAPAWAKPHQKKFESSPREHHAVLSVLRDACRHFAIDTDRVFLSGHSMGGTAAWEIGLAHPDLWAGVIPIVASPNKMIGLYWENAERVPMYFVGGEKDGETMIENAKQFERYMNRKMAFDVTAVEFLGRGHEHFSDEIIRIFDWMKRKRRDFFPQEFKVVTQREIDSFFWWVELQVFQPPPRPMQIESRQTANNGLIVQCGVKTTVWLSPEIIDFNRDFVVTVGRKTYRNIQPDIGIILEDARSRGERKHPFWAKIQ